MADEQTTKKTSLLNYSCCCCCCWLYRVTQDKVEHFLVTLYTVHITHMLMYSMPTVLIQLITKVFNVTILHLNDRG